MAEMLGSAAVQEFMSRGVSFVLGKREEKASQSQYMERLEMAASEMEHALEMSAELPILHVSLLKRRKMIKCMHAKVVDLLDKSKQQEQAVPASQEQGAQGVKRKWSWIIPAASKSLPISSSGAGLNSDDVKRFERFGVFAREFLRDLESGCSLLHYNFIKPIVRNLLDGKTLGFRLEQGNQARQVQIQCGGFDEERGVEAVLRYSYNDSTIMKEKSLRLTLVLRLSASTDIAGVAIKSLQLLPSQFKLAAEAAMEELVLLPTLLDGIANLNARRWVFYDREFYIMLARLCRPDPACCGARRQGRCSDNNVSSELSHMLPEEVICFHVRSSFYKAAGRSISSSRGWTSPLEVSALFLPHCTTTLEDARIQAGVRVVHTKKKRYDGSIKQVGETLESDAVSCFLRDPRLTDYKAHWDSKHGVAWFMVRNE